MYIFIPSYCQKVNNSHNEQSQYSLHQATFSPLHNLPVASPLFNSTSLLIFVFIAFHFQLAPYSYEKALAAIRNQRVKTAGFHKQFPSSFTEITKHRLCRTVILVLFKLAATSRKLHWSRRHNSPTGMLHSFDFFFHCARYNVVKYLRPSFSNPEDNRKNS